MAAPCYTGEEIEQMEAEFTEAQQVSATNNGIKVKIKFYRVFLKRYKIISDCLGLWLVSNTISHSFVLQRSTGNVIVNSGLIYQLQLVNTLVGLLFLQFAKPIIAIWIDTQK